MWRCSDELHARADELLRSSRKDAKHYIGMQELFGHCNLIVISCDHRYHHHRDPIIFLLRP